VATATERLTPGFLPVLRKGLIRGRQHATRRRARHRPSEAAVGEPETERVDDFRHSIPCSTSHSIATAASLSVAR
jgi:hypothetical protein